jgi:hypothetical protein
VLVASCCTALVIVALTSRACAGWGLALVAATTRVTSGRKPLASMVSASSTTSLYVQWKRHGWVAVRGATTDEDPPRPCCTHTDTLCLTSARPRV